jgi:hypothetical protein
VGSGPQRALEDEAVEEFLQQGQQGQQGHYSAGGVLHRSYRDISLGGAGGADLAGATSWGALAGATSEEAAIGGGSAAAPTPALRAARGGDPAPTPPRPAPPAPPLLPERGCTGWGRRKATRCPCSGEACTVLRGLGPGGA